MLRSRGARGRGVTMLRSRGARGRDSASGARGCNNAVEACTELRQISEKLLAHRCGILDGRIEGGEFIFKTSLLCISGQA